MERLSTISNINNSNDSLLSYNDVSIGHTESIRKKLTAEGSIEAYCDDILSRVMKMQRSQRGKDDCTESLHDDNQSEFKFDQNEERKEVGAIIDNALSSIQSIGIRDLLDKDNSRRESRLSANSNFSGFLKFV